MEIVDNAIRVILPGAMEAGLDDILFWGVLSFALAVAVAFFGMTVLVAGSDAESHETGGHSACVVQTEHPAAVGGSA